MNTGKCPHCKQAVEKAVIEKIEPDTQASKLYGAMPRGLAKRSHPDAGGSEDFFRRVVEARDRLLATLGTSAEAPKMPQFAPEGVEMRYRSYPGPHSRRLGQIRRLTA